MAPDFVAGAERFRYYCKVEALMPSGPYSGVGMSTNQAATEATIRLTDDDVAFLFSILRDPGRSQPLTTQQLIDAIRSRVAR